MRPGWLVALRAALRATTPAFSAADRAAQISARQQHVARRFRN